jgi:hypothetical protein
MLTLVRLRVAGKRDGAALRGIVGKHLQSHSRGELRLFRSRHDVERIGASSLARGMHKIEHANNLGLRIAAVGTGRSMATFKVCR